MTVIQKKLTNPFKATVLILMGIGLIMLIPIKTPLMQLGLSEFQTNHVGLSLKMTLIFLLSYLGIKRFKYEHIAGISPKYPWNFKSLNLIPCYLFLIGIASVISKDFTEVAPSHVLLLFASCMSVGFAEEFLFRGLLQPLYLHHYISKKNGIRTGVFCAALSFGLFHLLNLFSSKTILPVVIQVVYATFIGFFLGVMLLKTNKIVPLVVTHGLINFFFSLAALPGLQPTEALNNSQAITPSIIPILLPLPLGIIAWFLLPKMNRSETKEKLHFKTIHDEHSKRMLKN